MYVHTEGKTMNSFYPQSRSTEPTLHFFGDIDRFRRGNETKSVFKRGQDSDRSMECYWIFVERT